MTLTNMQVQLERLGSRDHSKGERPQFRPLTRRQETNDSDTASETSEHERRTVRRVVVVRKAPTLYLNPAGVACDMSTSVERCDRSH